MMLDGVSEEIAEDELLVRGICTPYHYDVKNGTLKKNAFHQKPMSKGVSVCRNAILNVDECRKKAKLLNNPDQKKEYIGLAVVSVGAVRKAGSIVNDTRHVYYGHADIFHDIPDPEPQEALKPELAEKLKDRLENILKYAQFFIDPSPTADNWSGVAPLTSKC